MAEARSTSKTQTPGGSQTLARGLATLQRIAASATGLTVQEVADSAGIHRTIAYRILVTLAQYHLISKGEDGRYRSASGLAALAASYDRGLRQNALPTLRALAEELRASVSLLVAEGDEQVAIAVVVPVNVSYQLSFHEGSRYPLDRGAAGVALLASRPQQPGERDLVTKAREQGWVITHGEIEPNTYGLAVPVPRPDTSPSVCINIISHREDVVNRSKDAAMRAAQRLSTVLH